MNTILQNYQKELILLKIFSLNFKPKRIVNLGCGTGLWLELINNTIDFDCEFIGIDSDKLALEEAKKKSIRWNKKSLILKVIL